MRQLFPLRDSASPRDDRDTAVRRERNPRKFQPDDDHDSEASLRSTAPAAPSNKNIPVRHQHHAQNVTRVAVSGILAPESVERNTIYALGRRSCTRTTPENRASGVRPWCSAGHESYFAPHPFFFQKHRGNTSRACCRLGCCIGALGN